MGSNKVEFVRTTTWSAGPGCHGGCGVLAHIKDGKLIKIEGDPDHPWNQGRLCARALAMTQYMHYLVGVTRDHAPQDPNRTKCICVINPS